MRAVTDKQLERTVSRTLHWGVLIAGTFMTGGFICYAVRSVAGVPVESPTAAQLLALVLRADSAVLLQPLTYLYAGILLLAFTPVARVVIAIAVFAMERDWYYVRISSLVLIIILSSILLAVLQ